MQVVLHRGLQRHLQLVAVLRIEVLGVLKQHVVLLVVLGGDHQTGFALQVLVVLRLQPVQAGVVGAHEADDMGGQIAVGIVPLGVGGQEHALDLVVVDVLPHLVGHILLHTVLQHLIHGVGPGHLFQDALLADVQDIGQCVGQSLLGPSHGILFVVQRVVDLLGGQKDGLRRGGNGQNVAGGVIDGAPVGVDHAAAGLLADGLGLQLLMAGDLQGIQLEKQHDEHTDAHNEHQHEGAGLDHPVGPADGFILPVGILAVLRHDRLLLRQYVKAKARSKKSSSYSLLLQSIRCDQRKYSQMNWAPPLIEEMAFSTTPGSSP